jgi:CheY-like chemotaxis protein
LRQIPGVSPFGEIFLATAQPPSPLASILVTDARQSRLRFIFRGVMTLQILVVEDHGDTRRVLTGLLGHFGHCISAADNVESALAFVRAKHFDAIVSDLALPDGSGCDVIREAKRCQRLTGVALTANGEDDDIARGRDAGFDYHLTKPIDFAQLREVLGRIAPANNGGVSYR